MLLKDTGWVGGSENGNFSLLYVLKMSLRRVVDASKKAKTPLRNIKMVPNLTKVKASSIM